MTLNTPPTAGNLLIAAIGVCDSIDQNTVSSLTQSGVFWTRQVSNEQNGVDAEIWAGEVTLGASSTLTIALTQTGSDANVLSAVADVCEYSGLVPSGFLDSNSNQRQCRSTNRYGNNLDYVSTGELWIGAIANNQYAQTNPANGFVLFDGQISDSGNGGLAYLQNMVSATGQADSGTSLPASATWSGCIATFKTSAVTPTATSTPELTPTPTAATSATPTGKPTLSPKATAPATGFGLLDWVIVGVVVIIVLILALFAFYGRRDRPAATMRNSPEAPPFSEPVFHPTDQLLCKYPEVTGQDNHVDEMPTEDSLSEDVVGEELGEGDEGVEESVSEIEIGPQAFNYLKRRGGVFTYLLKKCAVYVHQG